MTKRCRSPNGSKPSSTILRHDAIDRVSAPLDELAKYGISPGDGIDLAWLSDQLARFRSFVVDTAAAGKGAAVVIRSSAGRVVHFVPVDVR